MRRASPPSSGGVTYCWQWQENDGSWRDFDAKNNAAITATFNAGQYVYKYIAGNRQPYRADLRKMVQANTNTGIKRKIRKKQLVSGGVPAYSYHTTGPATLHTHPNVGAPPRMKVLPGSRLDVADLQKSDSGSLWGSTPGGWAKLKRGGTDTYTVEPKPTWFFDRGQGYRGKAAWLQLPPETSEQLERALAGATDVSIKLDLRGDGRGHGTFRPIIEVNGCLLQDVQTPYIVYAIRREPIVPRAAGATLTKDMYDVLEAPPKDATCHVCLDEFEEEDECISLNQCKHTYHRDCLKQWFQKGKPTCPYCSRSYAVIMGPQPPGQMTVNRHSWSCDSYSCGTIEIIWDIFAGVQTEKHQNPGVPFQGDRRAGYLPDNKEGQEILQLFQLAWERKQMFSVGMSVTRGTNNVVVWNGIHAKTNTSGGSSRYGYPDPDYFRRVKEELATKGVEG